MNAMLKPIKPIIYTDDIVQKFKQHSKVLEKNAMHTKYIIGAK